MKILISPSKTLSFDSQVKCEFNSDKQINGRNKGFT